MLQGLADASRAGDANALDGNGYGTLRRQMFDSLAPANAADLTPVELDDLMPAINGILPTLLTDPAMIKTHELARRNRDGHWIYPPEKVAAAIHLVRHPYDVAVSFANHMGWSAKEAVHKMGSPFSFSAEKAALNLPFPEPVGSWSNNVLSWTRGDLPYRCLTVRYEDLLEDAVGAFRRIAAFLDWEFENAELLKAVELSSFEKLQMQEQLHGFRERPVTSQQFFRAGRTMSWQGLLPADLRDRLWLDHGALMASLGYLQDGTTSPRTG